MSTSRTAVFPLVRYSRRIPDPNFHKSHGLERYILFVPVAALPDNLPLDPNPRAPNTNKLVYRAVRESLLNEDCEPGTFHLKHKGITLLAHEVERRDEETYVVSFREGHGILDGGHTYELIKEAKEEEALPTDQYVKCEILVGVDEGWIVEIAGGLNSSVQVQPMSLDNMGGLFDWIKEEIEDEPYTDKIAWFENAEGLVDARDIVSLLTCMNIGLFPNSGDKQPVQAYASKARALELFERHGDTYRKLRPILKDVFFLYDTIRYKSREIWNRHGGQFGSFTFVEERQRKEFEFPFIGATGMYRLMNGAALPMLAAFRWMVEEDPDSGEYGWRGGFSRVIKRWEESAPELIKQTAEANKEIGRNPNALGKSRNHWSNLHARVAMHDLISLRQEAALSS